MLLMQEPKLLLVDEPVAGMTPQETERTGRAAAVRWRGGTRWSWSSTTWSSCGRSPTGWRSSTRVGCWPEGGMDDVQGDPRVIEVYLGA